MTVNLRAMTYNIHSGFGRHGHDLHTILRVIEPEQADLVALQEVDFALRRSGYVNQAQWLADRLSMHAIIGGTRRQGRYGNALLTRWATTFVMNHSLTVPASRTGLPGGAPYHPKGTLRCCCDAPGAGAPGAHGPSEAVDPGDHRDGWRPRAGSLDG